jgi:hypothetical protein
MPSEPIDLQDVSDAVSVVEQVLALGGGGEEPAQMTEQTVEGAEGHIDHDSHFSWVHGFMFPVYGMVAVALIGAGVKLWLGRRK